MVAAAGLLWRRRHQLADKHLPDPSAQHKSSLLLGATIAIVEPPTAFPYFAAIAAVLGSGVDPPSQVLVLVLFNLCFVLPLIAILATLVIAGGHAERILTSGREFLQRRWPTVAAALLVGALFVIVLGASGFAAGGRGTIARTVRQVRRSVSP